MSVISIFGSGKVTFDSPVYQTAELVGNLLAKKGFDVATGAYQGIMEAVLKGAIESQVSRIGVTTKLFLDKKPNKYVNKFIETDTYLDRLQKLTDIADGFIILPGGSGTLLEFSYILTMKERNVFLEKPLICIGEQWKKILQAMGYDTQSSIKSLQIECVDNPEEAVNKIFNYLIC
ncbi:MAG: LOG family protein [bacterium]